MVCLAPACQRSVSAAKPGENNQGNSSRKGANAQGRPPVVVAAAPVQMRDVPVFLNGLGTVTPVYTVTIHSRVDGELVKINFREGQEVHKGDVLAEIDPRPFQVQLQQAIATKNKDEAALHDAQVNLERYRALYNDKVIAKQQLDTQASLVGQLQGSLGADEAQINNARLNLTYARITSPINGRVGLRLVDPGNIVHASDANGLLVVTQMDPIDVIFTLPEDYVPQVVKQMRKGSLPVQAYGRDDQTKIAEGKLITLNNEIDPTTGTDKLKARFVNTERLLWPNQFVNVHLLVRTKKNAIVIPVAAVQHGSQGTFTYVVGNDKKAQIRNIQVGLTQGTIAAVDSGLQPGELVVTDGQDKLQPGAMVQVQQQQQQPGSGSGRGGQAAE
jgi:multidrug efflux system membrane fusion protein